MLLQNSGTRLSQLMNTSGFHRNVGEGNKSLGKGSGFVRLTQPQVACPICKVTELGNKALASR